MTIKKKKPSLMVVMGIVTAVLIILVLLVDAKSDKEWAVYSSAHHCVLTADVPATTGIFNGRVLYIAGHKTYHCDGGEEITR